MTDELVTEASATAKPCQQCGAPVPPKAGKGGGRPKIFCSKRCAWAAGNDRKALARPARRERARTRRPLPDFAKDSGWKLRNDVERVERIFADNRFAQNKEQVTTHLRSHLEYAAEVCQDLLSRITTPQGE